MILSGVISGLCFLSMVVLALVGACAPKRPLVYNYRIPQLNASQMQLTKTELNSGAF